MKTFDVDLYFCQHEQHEARCLIFYGCVFHTILQRKETQHFDRYSSYIIFLKPLSIILMLLKLTLNCRRPILSKPNHT